MDGGVPVAAGGGLIGPNALLQLMAVLDRTEGPAFRAALFGAAGVAPPPSDAGMWPEADCAAVHRALRQALPGSAPVLLAAAGEATADYILAHRIPGPAQALLRRLPGWLAARLLSRAIARHAWTFAGSGVFRIAGQSPLTFEIAANPLIAGEVAPEPLCHWHAAVFARLFRVLVWPGAEVRETACTACGDGVCRFVILPRGGRPQARI